MKTKYKKPTRAERTALFYQMMSGPGLGFTPEETSALLRAERALQRWHELECGTGDDQVTISVERDEQTGKPFRRVQFMGAGGKWIDRREPCRDMEKGARKRIAEMLAGKAGLSAYIQSDPRGCALYILRQGDVPEGESADSYYSRGIAVCLP